MKTQTISLFLVAFLISGFVAWAQTPSKSGASSDKHLSKSTTMTKIDMHATSGGVYAEYGLPGQKGGAYLTPDFIDGVITFKDGSPFEEKSLRYNLYTQQIQYIVNEDTLALGNPGEIESIQMAGKTFVYTDFVCNDKQKSGYFELLESGDCRLLKRWVALYQKVDNSVGESGDGNVFYRDCHCFLQFFMNPAQPVNVKRKDFVKSFANHGDMIEDFMRRDKLKPKNEEDLIRIVEYFNANAKPNL